MSVRPADTPTRTNRLGGQGHWPNDLFGRRTNQHKRPHPPGPYRPFFCEKEKKAHVKLWLVLKPSFSVTNKLLDFCTAKCHGLLPFYERNCHVQVYVFINGVKKEEVIANLHLYNRKSCQHYEVHKKEEVAVAILPSFCTS